MLDIFGPMPPQGITDSSGIATLQIGHRGFQLRVDEPGYQMTDNQFGTEYFQELPKKGRPDAKHQGIDRVIELQPNEKPTFIVIVPNGFRGLIRMRFEAADEKPPPVRHMYTFDADSDGRVLVRLPRSLWATQEGREIAARYHNGRKVPWDARCPESEGTAIRYLDRTEDTELLLIGTGPEAEAIFQRILIRNPNHNSELDRKAYDALFHGW